MTQIRILPVTLALSLILASCGQQTSTPSAVSPDAVTTISSDGATGITAASAATWCNIVPNRYAYCYDSAPGTQYRYSVKCYDDGIANRFTFDYGAWRNQSGTYSSNATCPAGDTFHSWAVDFR